MLSRPHVLCSALLSLALIGSSGCTTFSDYNESTREPREAFLRGDFDAAVAGYREGMDAINDSLLYGLEAGMAAHVGRSYGQSFDLLDASYRKVVAYQDRALIEAADLTQKVGSVLVNDKTLPYTGEVFEQVLLQAYQAKNVYLAGKDENVITEAKRTYDLVDKGRKIYEQELRGSQKLADEKRAAVDSGEIESKMREAYAYEGLLLDDPEDVYDLRYVRYLLAFLRDAVADRQADHNAALIDMKYVADRYPDVPFVRRELARLTRLSGDKPGADAMLQRWGMKPLARGVGSVALFLESGLAPRKREFKMIFPTATGAAAFAMPIYEPLKNPVTSAVLVIGGSEEQTLLLTNLEQVCYRYHNDRLPLMIARQIIRLAIKIGVQEGGRAAIANNVDGIGGAAGALAFTIGASVWNVVSEQADLRCWRTLPQSLQATRIYLPPGDYPAHVELLGPGGSRVARHDLGTIRIAAGKHRMINARSLGRQLHVDIRREPYD